MATAGVYWCCVVLFVTCTSLLITADSVDDDEDEASFLPSLLSALGTKVRAADANAIVDNEYGDQPDAPPDAPCCFPDVWQGRVSSEFGFAGRRAVLSHSVDQVYVDGTNRRLAGNKLECDGKGHALNYSYILLVGANKSADMYLFDRAAKKCRYIKLSDIVWQKQCIPANATLRGTYSLGPSSGGLNVQSWSFRVGSRRAELLADRPRPRPKISLAANILVVPASCVPVVVRENGVVYARGGFGGAEDSDSSDEDSSNELDRPKPKPKPRPRGTPFIGSVYFSGVQPRITDPSVFTPPSYCKKGDPSLYFDDDDDGDDIVPSVLERYVAL